jgi:uncharacterized membrane protein
MVTGGLMNGYLIYLGFVLFLGGCGWLLFGWKHDRLILAAIMGAVWFFIPDNLRVLFDDGNLPRGIIAALLPWLLFFILEFIETKKTKDAIAIIVLTSIMALCHLGETGIIILCLILFFIVYSLTHKNVAGPLWIMPGIGISFLLIEFSTPKEVYLLPTPLLLDVYRASLNGGRKSIPYSYFQEHAYLVPTGFQPRIDYLKVINQFILKES